MKSFRPLQERSNSPNSPEIQVQPANEGTAVSNHAESSMTPLPSEDVPEALRDSSSRSSAPSSGNFSLMWVAVIGVGAIALGAITAFFGQPLINQVSSLSESANQSSGDGDRPDSEASIEEVDSDNPLEPEAPILLGHRFYEEAPEDTLVPVVGDGSVKLRQEAAEGFAKMVEAARADGIRLQPLSGFRTEADQEYLFFKIKQERNQRPSERAAVSAPPGYSEHHTGYALDIGDPTRPGTNVSTTFEETPAFEWLEENASAYSFELSFGKDPGSEVSYEPWHWRFVGDRNSLETFYGTQTAPLSPKPSDPSDTNGAIEETASPLERSPSPLNPGNRAEPSSTNSAESPDSLNRDQ